MTSSITVEPYETVEFPESDTDSWQVVDPFDSENDDVITTESDVISSDDEDEDEEDVDVVVDDVIPSESDVISSKYDEEDEDEDEEDDEEDDDDVISSDEDEDDEEDEDDVITSEDEEEEDEDDVITAMSSDEMTNHTTQELNGAYETDHKASVELDGPCNDEILDSMREDAYWDLMQLERVLEEEEEEDEDYDEEDLDDELIPRWLNNKFERQRMRKLGKKVYPKMKKSKRMVNQYNRPGCAGAKHGLGLKHNLI